MRKFLTICAFILILGGLPSMLVACSTSIDDTGKNAEVILAETGDETNEELDYDPQTDFLCAQAMLDQGYPLVLSYETFLDEYFKIDAPSSEQVDMAITAYRAVEDTLRGIYDKNVDLENEKTFESAGEEDYYCTFLRDEYVEFAKLLLQKQVIASSNSKTTFKIIDGLKDVNANLEELTLDFLTTFPNYFEKMQNALPCYARQCIVN